MTEEETTVVTPSAKEAVKEAVIVLVLSTVVGILADIGVQKGYQAYKARRAAKTEVAAIEQ